MTTLADVALIVTAVGTLATAVGGVIIAIRGKAIAHSVNSRQDALTERVEQLTVALVDAGHAVPVVGAVRRGPSYVDESTTDNDQTEAPQGIPA